MERRAFIRNSFLVTNSILVAPTLFGQTISKRPTKRIVILHTNDTHSNIDPFPVNHAKYPGLGGVARRYDLIEQVRSEEENVLLLDAGDIFQGTPYFNKYKGVLEMKLMKEMGYDVATMGNHDFDIGLSGFLNAHQFANFPFICSNYDFKNTLLEGVTSDKLILEKGGVKIGLFGLGVELDGLVPKENYLETKYVDPIEIATDKVSQLKSEGCDLIICLSHLGYTYEDEQKISDLKLAQQTGGIHLIIGGHTHTFLDKPTEVINSEGNTVLVNQVGWAGVNVGRLDFEIETKAFAKKDVLIVK